MVGGASSRSARAPRSSRPVARAPEIEIKRDGDHLIGQATGQPAFRLFATSDTHFFLRAVPAEIDFVRDSGGKISELVLHQNGQNLHGRRRPAPR
jgi:hypothetical protein